MANGVARTRAHGRQTFETPSGCIVCDGPPRIYKSLGEWPCTKAGCGAGNRPQNAVCFVAGCNGQPEPKRMAEQAKAQKFFNDNEVGSAPYVPPARGG